MNKSTSDRDLRQLTNFDLSVIIPLNKCQWNGFVQRVPDMKKYYQRNGIEIVLVADKTMDEASLLEFVKCFPMIDWKVIICGSLNTMQKINTGIRQSEKKYVLLLDPQWEFQNDVIYLLSKNIGSYYSHYRIGQIAEGEQGAILVRKEYLELIGGLDETITSSTIGINNLQKRMELAGINKLYYPNAILLHHRNSSTALKPLMEKRMFELSLPVKAVVNDKSWGSGYHKILFNWRNNPFASEQCEAYLKELGDYSISNNDIFNSTYKLIALIPTYNESERISDCLKSVENHCDGIIILDDDSTDQTYEMVQSKKLLLKVRKKRNAFNDKQNRNILLDIAYYFHSEWFIFIDADERFDERFVDLPEIMADPKIDVSGVWIANLWDNMGIYRTNMQDSNPISKIGLWFRWRMFRNKGRMQITASRTFHFSSVPYMDYTKVSQTLLLHIGYLTIQKRLSKYDFYQMEDPQNESYYSDILEEKIETAPVCSISKAELIPTSDIS